MALPGSTNRLQRGHGRESEGQGRCCPKTPLPGCWERARAAAPRWHTRLGSGSPAGSKCAGAFRCVWRLCPCMCRVCAGMRPRVCLSLPYVLPALTGSVSCSPTVGPGPVSPTPTGTLHTPTPWVQLHQITWLGPAGAGSSAGATPALDPRVTSPPPVPVPAVPAPVLAVPALVPMPVPLARAGV